jgi:hypothetical protein
MYEHKSQPLAPLSVYYRRIGKNAVSVAGIFFVMLLIGTAGYHFATFPVTPWLDAFHNASMILSGMGPVVTNGFVAWGKIFSSFYALFSGVIFITSIGFILAPGIHRIFHRLHLEQAKN